MDSVKTADEVPIDSGPETKKRRLSGEGAEVEGRLTEETEETERDDKNLKTSGCESNKDGRASNDTEESELTEGDRDPSESLKSVADDDPRPRTKRDDEFTSEIFKIEIHGLPRHTGYAQLKKFLVKRGLEPKKLKIPPWHGGALVTFSNEEDRQKAVSSINDGAVVKGRHLSATLCKAHADPFLKAESQSKDANPPSLEELGAKLLQAVVPLQSMSYEEQLAMKEKNMNQLVKNLIENSIAKINEDLYNVIHAQRMKNLKSQQTSSGPRCRMLPIIGSPLQFGYRNKNEFTIGEGPKAEGSLLTVGFRIGSYSDGTLTVMDPSECKILPPLAKTTASRFQAHFRSTGLPPFNPRDHEGHWRQLTVRTTELGHVMVVVAMHAQDLTEERLAKVKADLVSFCTTDPDLISVGLRSLYFSRVGFSSRESNQQFELLHGEETIVEKLAGREFRISPDAFFQANTSGAELLIETIGSWLREDDTDAALLDVCCGTGTIGIALSDRAPCVIGVECVEKAVEDARKNTAANSVSNVEFVCGKAEDVLPDLVDGRFAETKRLFAVVDPPRAGLHKRVLQAIRRCSAIDRFIYVSCNPKLAKDNFVDLARAPSKKGFKGFPFLPVKAVPIDLFPQTNHCELVILFERVTAAQIEEAKRFMELREKKEDLKDEDNCDVNDT